MNKKSSCFINILFCSIALMVVGFIPALGLAEHYVLLSRNGTESYYYDKDSVVKVGKWIKEVRDANHAIYPTKIVTTEGQIRIDCRRHKFALGETVSWVGKREVSHFIWNKYGWVWVDITKDNFNHKLFKAVCGIK